jgi:GMP synthase-like glutamine amidotransferase
MNSVVVFRHAATEGPGYFATFLERYGIPWTLVKLDEGEPVPADPCAFSGAALMGGSMSANDDLPWINPVLEFVRAAVDTNVPLIGHCLGGQLISKALGGVVSRNPVKEIGWAPVDIIANDTARKWLGGLDRFESFHWHGETFTIPPGAVRIASSTHCANQMYALGPHIGMQCHIEMTPELIALWCKDWGKEIVTLAQRTSSVQTPEEMLDHVEEKVRGLNAVADRIYTEWIRGLQR